MSLVCCCVNLSRTVISSFSVGTHAYMHCASCLPLLLATHAYYALSGSERRCTLLALTIQDVFLCLSALHRDGWRRRVALLPVLLLILQQELSSCQMRRVPVQHY